jgi:hypothetical protein
MSATHTTTSTPQRIIRDWVTDYANDHPDITRRDLVDAARSEFADDPAFTDALLDWAFTQLVPREADRLMRTEGRLKTGDGWVTCDELARRTADPGSPWARWRQDYRLIDADGALIELPDMTRRQLLDAAHGRREVAREALVGVAFLTKLAGALTGEQRVRDVFTPDELAAVHANASQLKAAR